MSYDGPDRRSDSDLREDINALSAQVAGLNTTIQTTFVKRVELDEYPDFEVMYARMDALEERIKQEHHRTFWRQVVGFLVVLGVVGAAFLWQAEKQEGDRIKADLQSCERGNNRGRQVRAGFAAVDKAINQIVDRADPDGSFDAELTEPLAILAATPNEIQITDCTAAVPGAKERER